MLAMCYEAHAHHDRVSSWLREKRFVHSSSLRLATSPITELGFVRIASGPAGFASGVDEAQTDLERLVAQQGLAFVEDRLRASPLPQWVRKFTQTTDGHLLQVAVSHGLTLATLDRGIRGAEVIPEIHVQPLRVQEAGVLVDKYPVDTHSVDEYSNDDGLWLR